MRPGQRTRQSGAPRSRGPRAEQPCCTREHRRGRVQHSETARQQSARDSATTSSRRWHQPRSGGGSDHRHDRGCLCRGGQTAFCSTVLPCRGQVRVCRGHLTTSRPPHLTHWLPHAEQGRVCVCRGSLETTHQRYQIASTDTVRPLRFRVRDISNKSFVPYAPENEVQHIKYKLCSICGPQNMLTLLGYT